MKDRLDQAFDSLPSKLKDHSDCWLLDRTTSENYFQLSKHLDRDYNHFLLQRTLVQRLKTSPAELIRVSNSLLSAVLVLASNRHRMSAYSADLPWLVCLSLSFPAAKCTDSRRNYVDCTVWAASRWPPRAGTTTAVAESKSWRLRFSPVRRNTEIERSRLLNRLHCPPYKRKLRNMRPG